MIWRQAAVFLSALAAVASANAGSDSPSSVSRPPSFLDQTRPLNSRPSAADKVLRYSFDDRAGVEEALRRIEGVQDLDVWHRTPTSFELRVSPLSEGLISSLLAASTSSLAHSEPLLLQIRIIIPSVSALLASSPFLSTSYNLQHSHQAFSNLSSTRYTTLRDPIHSSYHPYDSIVTFLRQLAADFPDYAQIVSLGPSSEGREIIGLQITNGSSVLPQRESEEGDWSDEIAGGTEEELLRSARIRAQRRMESSMKKLAHKIGFVVVGAQHAREWIAPATVLFLAHKLLLSTIDPYFASKGDIDPSLLNSMSFTFIPVVNVDGYVYSWEHDRLWRKNRQDVGRGCFGVDLNRNWEYKWSAGRRPNPCSDAFPGSAPFEAPELKALSSYILDPANHVAAFLDLHSFGQEILFPYSWTCDVSSPDEENHLECALGAAKALRAVHGRFFEVGSVCSISLSSPGESIDWTYEVAGVRWSFAIELRDYIHGFLLPPSQIVPSSEELGAALFSMADFVLRKESGKRVVL